uniref:Carboxylic ester hydrolase n=1 Tax=Ciona savignyi TaxID=51511 RepID=H2ZN21_CIOSA
ATFQGIPFAQPPVGELRFAAPQPPLSWEPDVKMTSEFGNSCIQEDDLVFGNFTGSQMWNSPNAKSEDCLYLNVWTPVRSRHAEPLAVLVWIYGGSYYSGTSSLALYDGRYLAATGGVVVVSLNYRLGPIGFLAPLADETPGNVGLLDQQLALKWVRDNIREFGGNPNNVTVMGESAGAASIGLHTIAPSSRGLFSRVILQSGNQMTPWSTISLETSLNRTRTLAANLNCPKPRTASEADILACLRTHTANEVFAGSWITKEIFDFPFVPVHGTTFLPEHPHEVSSYIMACKLLAIYGIEIMILYDTDVFISGAKTVYFLIQRNVCTNLFPPYFTYVNFHITLTKGKCALVFKMYFFVKPILQFTPSTYYLTQRDNTGYCVKSFMRKQIPFIISPQFSGRRRNYRLECHILTCETYGVKLQLRKHYGNSPEQRNKMAGDQAEVDVLAGYNTNEGSYFTIYTVPGYNITTNSRLEQYLSGVDLSGLKTNTMGRSAAAFMYTDWENLDNELQYRDAVNEIVGDFHVVCPTVLVSKRHSNSFPNRNVFLYHLSYRVSTNPWPIWMGVMHGYEIELMFGTPWFGNSKFTRGYSDLDRSVSRRMVRYWTNFAKFGNPNGLRNQNQELVSDWPRFNDVTQRYLEIADDDVTMAPFPDSFRCAFWQKYLPSLQLASSNMDEVETKWKIEFHRWSESMDLWDRSFKAYSSDDKQNSC